MMFYANNGQDEDKVELFGVKFVLADILSIDPESSDKSTRKLKALSQARCLFALTACRIYRKMILAA